MALDSNLMEELSLQRAEFDALTELSKAHRNLPPIVDDDYPYLRSNYEGALFRFVRALKDNRKLEVPEQFQALLAAQLEKERTSVLQTWVEKLGRRHQGVLVSAMRGCDIAPKYDPSKMAQRLIRGAILIPHVGLAGNPKTYIRHEKDEKLWWEAIEPFLFSYDHYPNHYVIHWLNAIEIIEYHGPLSHPVYSDRWLKLYERWVHKMHLRPELKDELDKRLNADEESFFANQDDK